ncbi:MAG: MBL fold metallo-hydrolase [Candidatus Kryptonium sp.]|nr:MBL fold metallo-hydrolase [Candidatus Kryptonium sp.]
MLKLLLLLGVIFILSFRSMAYDGRDTLKAKYGSININGKFYNLDPNFKRGKFSVVFPFIAKRIFEAIFGGGNERKSCDFQIVKFDNKIYERRNPENKITWVGHSTFLVQMDGVNFITDPVFSDKVGPFNNKVGSRRYVPLAFEIERLPKIDFVIISHNHYDHLDIFSLKRIVELNPDVKIFVPLKVKKLLDSEGIGKNAVELDWWDEFEFKGLKIIFTPTQHFSGRWIDDSNETLWGGYVVIGRKRFYFGGDSGYFFGFKLIGEVFGPFDLVCLPIGSYEPAEMMRPVHMNPEEAVKAYLDLKGKIFCPMHWGTFDLSDERCDEPPNRLMNYVKKLKLDEGNFKVFKHGETLKW